MAYYDLKLYKMLYLRFGAGIGVGLNRCMSTDFGADEIDVIPYLDFQFECVLKFSRVELSFAPLVFFGPSRFTTSLMRKKDLPYRHNWYLSGPSLSIGFRF